MNKIGKTLLDLFIRITSNIVGIIVVIGAIVIGYLIPLYIIKWLLNI